MKVLRNSRHRSIGSNHTVHFSPSFYNVSGEDVAKQIAKIFQSSNKRGNQIFTRPQDLVEQEVTAMVVYKGVILLAGPSKGTRFRPLSMDIPKPLFNV